MEKISLSVNLINQIMGYLGTRPYQEVFQMVNGLQDEAKQAVTEEPKAPTES